MLELEYGEVGNKFKVPVRFSECGQVAVKPILDAVGLKTNNQSAIIRLKQHQATLAYVAYPARELALNLTRKCKVTVLSLENLDAFLKSFNPRRCKHPEKIIAVQNSLVRDIKTKTLKGSTTTMKPTEFTPLELEAFYGD